MSIETLVGIVNESKLKGRRVVMSNGCFDILHTGHLEYLEGAKALGDLLVVGVNSDDSVQSIKQHYPIINENDRARLVASLQCVDEVFIFREETLSNSLTVLLPHLYALGIDKVDQKVEELSLCREIGISFCYVGDRKKNSSSYLTEMLYQRYDHTKNKINEEATDS